MSLECYSMAHELVRGTSASVQEAFILQNIGLAYNGLGDNKRFQEYLAEADFVWSEWETVFKERTRYPNYFALLGKYYQDQGQFPKALEQYRRSLELSPNAPQWAIFSIYDKIGTAETRQQNFAEGLKYFEMNLELSKGVYRAKTLYELGNAHHQKALAEGVDSSGRFDLAQDYLQQALEESRAAKDVTIEANVLLLQARIQLAHGGEDPGGKLKTAITLIETKRKTVKDASLRSDFFADNQKFYNTYITYLLKQEGGEDEALHVAEGKRARNLLDVLNEQSDPERGSFDWDLLKRYWWTHHQIEDIPAGEQASRVLQDYKQELALIMERRREPGLSSEKILSGAEIRHLAAQDDTVFLEYNLAEEEGRVWMITSEDITTVRLPGRKELDPLIRSARAALCRHPSEKAPEENSLAELDAVTARVEPGISNE